MRALLSIFLLLPALAIGQYEMPEQAVAHVQRLTSGGNGREVLLEWGSLWVHLEVRPDGLALQKQAMIALGSATFTNEGRGVYFAGRSWQGLKHTDLQAASNAPADLPVGRPKNTSGYADGPTHLAASRDGRFVAALREEHLDVYDTVAGKTLLRMPLSRNYGMLRPTESGRMAFSPDGRLLAVSHFLETEENGRFQIRPTLTCIDVVKAEILWQVLPKSHHRDTLGEAHHLVFNPDGTRLYSYEGESPEDYAKSAAYVVDYLQRDARTGAIVREHPLAYKTHSLGADHTADTRYTVYVGKEFITVLDTETFEIVSETWPGDDLSAKELSAVVFLGDRRWILATARDRPELFLFDTQKDEQAARIWLDAKGEDWVAASYLGYFQGTANALAKLAYVEGERRVPLDSRFATNYDPRLFGRLMDMDGRIEPPPAPNLAVPSITIALAGTGSRGLVVEDDLPAHTVEGDQATIEVAALAGSGHVTDLRLYHNGKLVANRSRGLVVEDDPALDETKATFTVALLPGPNDFRAVALNDQKLESAPAEMRLLREGPTESAGGIGLHVLVVGIDAYQNPRYNLNYAVADAEAFVEALKEHAKDIFARVEVTTLFNEEASRTALEAAFGRAQLTAGPRDVFVFYYAGHGVMSEDGERNFFLMPAESTQLYGTTVELASRAVSSSQLQAWSRDIPAQKQLFLLDACQSAGALEAVAVRGAAQEKAIAQLSRSTGTHWLAASGSEQFASEVEELGHGVFTHALIEGLKGAADSGDGRVTVNELKSYLEAQVPELTRQYKGTPQYPASFGSGQDFPLGLLAPPD